jgi:hypothetical protein
MILTGLTRERPRAFRLNVESPLARGAIFAGLGAFAGGLHYHDSVAELKGGGGNHGTLTNMDPPTDWVWSPELGRMVLDFGDGINDYIGSFAKDPSVGLSGLSCSCWHYSSITGNSRGLVGAWTNDTNMSFLFFTGSADYLYFRLLTSVTSTVVSTTMVQSASPSWKSLVGTWNGATMRLYVNAQEEGTPQARTGTIAFPASANFEICRYASNNSTTLVGRLADVILHSRALSQSEISALADQSNVLLRCGGVDLIQGVRTLWPGWGVGAVAMPVFATNVRSRSGGVPVFGGRVARRA